MGKGWAMIVFQNPGEIDIRSISTFGVSVKVGENPIGFFGTGLKYALAVLLRTGHQVTIFSGLRRINFGVLAEQVRGQEFMFVTMDEGGNKPASIGFTTELGKQWELWMAYRELACNCQDEEGVISHANKAPEPREGWTQIVVRGEDFESVYQDRHRYILDDQPQFTSDMLEVRSRSGHALFYRGVQVMQFKRPGLYTYNLLAKLELTEDRTVKSAWDVTHRLATNILKSTNKRFLFDVLTADEHHFESELDFHGWGTTPSQEFIDTVGSIVQDRRLKVNETAMKVWKDVTKNVYTPAEVELTSVQRKALAKALDFCGQIGFPIRGTYPIKVVESLGEGGLGLAENGTIFIAERVFHLGGTKQLASTLIEEYVHLRHGYKDMTRDLQSFLFDKVVSLGEELQGEPL